MADMYAEQLMILSSVQVFLAKPEYIKPEAFGSGFFAKYKGDHYFISVFHVIKHIDLDIFLETNLPPDKDDTVPVVPIGGFVHFDLLKIPEETSGEEFLDLIEEGGQKIDITFSKVDQLPAIYQNEMDLGFFKVERSSKMFLDLDYISVPKKEELYGFYGKTRHKYEGKYLKMQPVFHNGLKYFSSSKGFHKFIASKNIEAKEDFEGCSGAPILDSEGRLVAIACKVATGTKIIYGFSIHKCIEMLDMAIKAKQF